MDNKQNETATETADGKSLNHSVTDRKLGFVSFFDSQVTKVEVLSDMDAVEPVNGSSRVHNIKIEIEADQQRISSSAPLIAVEDGNLVPELSPIAQINSGVGGQFVIERHDGTKIIPGNGEEIQGNGPITVPTESDSESHRESKDLGKKMFAQEIPPAARTGVADISPVSPDDSDSPVDLGECLKAAGNDHPSDSAKSPSSFGSFRKMRNHCMNLALGQTQTDLGGAASSPEASVYQIKWISFRGHSCAIVTQNHNGPCPLISVINVLLLTKRMNLPEGIEYQSGENLLSQLASIILESIPEKASDDVVRNHEQNVQDVITILPKLQTGIDINVKFSGPRQYEFTQETLIFDLLSCPLVHGWIVDASDVSRKAVEKHASYNGIVEFVINGKSSEDQATLEEALLAEDWLERTQSQLTYAGLVALSECLVNDAPCVLFRNNHFSTILKHDNLIYQLVTDEGYAAEKSCVWEQLSNIEGDTDFWDDRFNRRVPSKAQTPPVVRIATPLSSHVDDNRLLDEARQMELDEQLALSLSQDQQFFEFPPISSTTPATRVPAISPPSGRPLFGPTRPPVPNQGHKINQPLQAPNEFSDSHNTQSHLPPFPNHCVTTPRPNVTNSQSAYELNDTRQTRVIPMSSGRSDFSATTHAAVIGETVSPYDRRFESDHNLAAHYQQPQESHGLHQSSTHQHHQRAPSPAAVAGSGGGASKKDKSCVIA